MPAGLAELSAQLGLTKPSTLRILHTLEVLGQITRDENGQYVRERHLPAPADALQALAHEFRETVSMAALLDNHIEVIAVIDSPHLIRMGNIVGRILPPHASSMGKAITAFQSPALRDRLLRAYGTPAITPRTITGEIELRKEFERIRKQGFAEDREENTTGGVCFAAPILRNGAAIAAISMSMPKARLTSPAKIVAALRNTAAVILKQHSQ